MKRLLTFFILAFFFVLELLASGCIRTSNSVLSQNCSAYSGDLQRKCHYDKAVYYALNNNKTLAMNECKAMLPTGWYGSATQKLFAGADIIYYNDCVKQVALIFNDTAICSNSISFVGWWSLITDMFSKSAEEECTMDVNNEQMRWALEGKFWEVVIRGPPDVAQIAASSLGGTGSSGSGGSGSGGSSGGGAGSGGGGGAAGGGSNP